MRHKTNETYHLPRDRFLSAERFHGGGIQRNHYHVRPNEAGHSARKKERRVTRQGGSKRRERENKREELFGLGKMKREKRSNIAREAHRPGESRYYLLPARSTFPLSSLQRE